MDKGSRKPVAACGLALGRKRLTLETLPPEPWWLVNLRRPGWSPGFSRLEPGLQPGQRRLTDYSGFFTLMVRSSGLSAGGSDFTRTRRVPTGALGSAFTITVTSPLLSLA